MEEKNPDSQKNSDDDILETAKQRFTNCIEAEAQQRKKEMDDYRFRAGDQWDDNIKRDREIEKRPCLTINRIPQFVQQVTNDQRQNRPAVKISPMDDLGDVDTAKVIQGLIRNIEYNSSADIAYDTAFEQAVTGGIGYWRYLTQYVNPMSFDQEIVIKRIRNRFTVYKDPSSKEPDGSDMNFCFVNDWISTDEYKANYPDSKMVVDMANNDDWSSFGDRMPLWANRDSVRVVEYFYKEFEKAKIHLLSDGQFITDKMLKNKSLPDGVTVLNSRETVLPSIKWCKINGMEILEKKDWPGIWIPIVPVFGNEIDIDGEVELEGIIRHSKDAQRMYNYWVSAETETIALAPKAPFIGAEGQFEDHEHEWATANVRTHAFLRYKPQTVNGLLVPPPVRNVYEPPVQAITSARMLSADDLKATTGIYDASLGNRSNEQSGVAIQRRNVQSQTANFHFVDNLTRSQRHGGRILVDLIPKIYDAPRAVRIIGEDREEKVIRINQFFEEHGEQKFYDFSVGKYDVAIETGPSYATKRQEALASIIGLINAYPALAQYIPDLLVKMMDWPESQKVSERLKKVVPPEILDDDDRDKQQKQIPPEIQQKMSQMTQVIEAMTQQLNDAQDKLDNKRLELESKERIEMAKLEVDIHKTLATLDAADARILFQQDMNQINQRQQLLRENQPIGDENEMGEGNEQGMESEQIEQPGVGPQGAMAPNQYQQTGVGPNEAMAPQEF